MENIKPYNKVDTICFLTFKEVVKRGVRAKISSKLFQISDQILFERQLIDSRFINVGFTFNHLSICIVYEMSLRVQRSFNKSSAQI